MLMTNLGYFYLEECCRKDSIACKILKQAVNEGSAYPETYFALASLYYKKKKYKTALPYFKTAYELSAQFAYQYNYAICLHLCGLTNDAVQLLKELSQNWEKDADTAKAYYLAGMLLALQNCMEEARQIAFDLFAADYISLDIAYSDLAELFYLIEEYEKCVWLYDSDQLMETADWLGIYFYSLKIIGQENKAKDILTNSLKNIDEAVMELQIDKAEWEEKELEEFMEREQKRSVEITECYRNVMENNQKPKVLFELQLLYKCYYIGCPRHYDVKFFD